MVGEEGKLLVKFKFDGSFWWRKAESLLEDFLSQRILDYLGVDGPEFHVIALFDNCQTLEDRGLD